MYGYIVADLEKAQQLLPVNYNPDIHPIAYQIRHTKDVATAYLAKVYFQMLDNANALAMCNQLLGPISASGSTKFPLNDDFADVFQREGNNAYGPGLGSEIIYAAEGTTAQKLTQDSKWNYYRNTRPSGARTNKFMMMGQPFKDLFDQANDRRFLELVEVDGTGNWWQNKFAKAFVNLPVLRAPEFHLMRAEINARNNNLSDALIDLNVVRNRSGLEDFVSADQQEIIDEIIDERARELFAESNRFLDMKRLGALTDGTIKVPLGEKAEEDKVYVGGVDVLPWDSDLLQYDLPSNEVMFNPGL